MRALATFAAFSAILVLLAVASRAQQPAYDLVIRNARILDGTGSPWYRADVAVRGDTIARIAFRIEAPAARTIDVARPDRGAGLHRHPLSRARRHLRGADGRELHPPGRDDGHRGPRRILPIPAKTVSGEGGGHTRDA